ncbi:Elongator subunit elp6 [Coemansia thaxteri]|uniref:Elongator subunit elp6 n=1 Tax=Coemansia thaxteri TaxID=2663907 RepID=A0A9W8ELL7_9FUNG|nr:Elongator subunit elp6 [Coemansia thaxteri]
MAAYKTLSACLNWPTGLPPSDRTTTLVTGGLHADGSVLVPHFIASAIDQQIPFVLVSFTQTFSHYIHIMRKMGVNLASQQNLQFVSALAAPVSQDLLSNLPPATRPHFVLDPDNWPAFFNWLNAQPPSLLIIDGLCSLLDQGMAADRALSFFKACQSSAAKLVVCMFADDETSVPLAHAIVRRCHHVFSFDGLVSGASTDVSGQLTVVGGHLLCQLPNEQRSFKPVVLHYKISDSSVHFFSPGQSRIVL